MEKFAPCSGELFTMNGGIRYPMSGERKQTAKHDVVCESRNGTRCISALGETRIAAFLDMVDVCFEFLARAGSVLVNENHASIAISTYFVMMSFEVLQRC